MTQSDPISLYEEVIKRGIQRVREELERTEAYMGPRPLLRLPYSEEKQYNEYREMRSQPYSMYQMMQAVWQDIESRLVDLGPQEREDKGVGPAVTRELAILEVLQHCDKMRRYELKHMARSEDTTPPLPY